MPEKQVGMYGFNEKLGDVDIPVTGIVLVLFM